MVESIFTGYAISFDDYCPILREKRKKLGITFNPNEALASETYCSEGDSIPGVEVKPYEEFLIPSKSVETIVYCPGCTLMPGGFEEQIEQVKIHMRH